ncbi:hypothetical protein G7Y89_g1987 [Cudoniella acicularis]|uniref:Manganese/iron superoxide dismutase C-terminal domain-containing protein n=1 Tax=Cudoniella acicularis TaxID=354080 RepID=A0A8H4RVA3_9HELO|nr:hypothetical protein G7Y89_g1987 [Cudoniella acicularis]
MLRPTLPRIGRSLGIFRRSLHRVPLLAHEFSKGVPGLLSPSGFDVAWTQYQKLMIDKLNLLTAGQDSIPPKELAIKYARDPAQAPTFNYASMAHNNNFFFSCLTPDPKPMPAWLQTDLEASFSSIETLRREFILTTNAMFGPGFVWLMKTKQRKYAILTTYLAGSPYPAAHYRQQPVDMNTEDKSISEVMRKLNREPPANSVGAHSGGAKTKGLAPGALDAQPILCINTWEHVYLPDYGHGTITGGGKKQFAENWWQAIDWEVVGANAGGPQYAGGTTNRSSFMI